MDAAHKAEIDRLIELTNVGAERAADAFARLVGRPIRAEYPVVVEGASQVVAGQSSEEQSTWSTGVFFEFEGCLDAIVGILFPDVASETLVRRIVEIESRHLAPMLIESALMEVSNILASHVASAIADSLGSRLLPSIPQLAMDDAEGALRSLIESSVGGNALRIESVLSDEAGELRGRLVMVPRSWPETHLSDEDSDAGDL